VQRVAGVDEAGRGPLAGPVVAAAVILPTSWFLQQFPRELRHLNDSKQLTLAQREEFHALLVGDSEVHWALGEASPEEIDLHNILVASHLAMLRALRGLICQPDHVLVDGLHVKIIPFPQTALVKGDSRSYSIAAASVIAKVSRDHCMLNWDRSFPGYGFAEHKGYPTPQHCDAIRRLGPCPIHRRSFSPFKPVQLDLL
jgi:ribonuclease HII